MYNSLLIWVLSIESDEHIICFILNSTRQNCIKFDPAIFIEVGYERFYVLSSVAIVMLNGSMKYVFVAN